jgi:hypothetical protein
MKYQIESFCAEVKRMIYDDNERIDDNGFDFKEHSRILCLVDLSEEEQALSSAYVFALEQQKKYYSELIIEREKLLKNIADKMLEIDAEHTENRQKHAEKIRHEAELLDGVMVILVNGCGGQSY